MINKIVFESDIVTKRVNFQLNETVVTIITDKKCYVDAAINEIIKCRKEIKKYIEKNPVFNDTLDPFICEKNSPDIIKKMCGSSEKFNIGPMSTVAGIIAEYSLKKMISLGARHAIVDNGGDIALVTNRPIKIGLYTGRKYTGQFAFNILPQDQILGICTSSGKIGHSFSFGNTDSVTIFSRDVALADGAATAVANQINTGDEIEQGCKILDRVDGIIGATVVIDNKIGFWGKVPEIVEANVPYKLITQGVV